MNQEEISKIIEEAEKLYYANNYQEVVSFLTDDILAACNNASLYFKRAYANDELGSIEESIKDYDIAIHLNPKNAEAYNNRGIIRKTLGQYEEAIMDYDEAIKLKSDFADAFYNRGNAKIDLGRCEEAIQDFDESIKLDPIDGSAYNNRGVAYKRLGQYTEAVKDYDEAIKLDPKDSVRYRNKGIALEALNNYEEALVCYQKAIELKPDDNYAKQLLDELKLRLSMPQLKDGGADLLPKIIAIVDAISEMVKVGDDYIKACHIAHYTKLFVADAVITKKIDKKEVEINPNIKLQYDDTRTLRYYNASYMNDPTEGRVLLDFWDIDDVTNAFNNAALGQDSTIYLGSFVEVNYASPANSHDDDLFLWRTYGKDEIGMEGGGCCMVFEPSFFDMHSENDATRTTAKQALHKVFYIDRATKNIEIQLPVNLSAEENKKIEELRDKLKLALDELGALLKQLVAIRKDKTNSEEEKDETKKVNEFIYQQLSRIRYFFKSADYKYENELRIVHEAPMDSELIHCDVRNEGKTKLLFVNSNRPVISHLKKIVLGPKVSNPDSWIYLSAVMAQYYKDNSIADRKFELRRSKTPFR